jgi:hypothetical protein
MNTLKTVSVDRWFRLSHPGRRHPGLITYAYDDANVTEEEGRADYSRHGRPPSNKQCSLIFGGIPEI